MKQKTVIYYVSVFVMLMAFMQLIITISGLRKAILLQNNSKVVYGIIIDKFIQERFQGPETGYRLLFETDSLNKTYSGHYFKSYNDKYSKGDTLAIYHYADNTALSRLSNFRDVYGELIVNAAIALLLMLVAWIGMRKHTAIMEYIRWK